MRASVRLIIHAVGASRLDATISTARANEKEIQRDEREASEGGNDKNPAILGNYKYTREPVSTSKND